MNVVIDGAVVGTPAGWTSRSDLTALFPTGFSSLSSALAVFPVDTAGLANGVHTIAWGVVANNGQSAGIGSRYFTVTNGSALQDSRVLDSRVPSVAFGFRRPRPASRRRP